MKRSRLRSMSPKKKVQMEEYAPRAVAFKKRKPTCEVCRKRKTKDVHHRAGRLGGNLLNEDTWTAVCRRCHDWIHDHPREAREKGLLQ